MGDSLTPETGTPADLATAERDLDAAAVQAGILEGFGLDPEQARASCTAAGEQMRDALTRLAAGE